MKQSKTKNPNILVGDAKHPKQDPEPADQAYPGGQVKNSAFRGTLHISNMLLVGVILIIITVICGIFFIVKNNAPSAQNPNILSDKQKSEYSLQRLSKQGVPQGQAEKYTYYLEMGDSYYDTKNYDLAINAYQEALKSATTPNQNLIVLVNMINTSKLQNNTQQAQAYIVQARELAQKSLSGDELSAYIKRLEQL